LYIIGFLSVVKEGFGNPWTDIFNKIKQIQDESTAYDKWVGYLYKKSSVNSEILNDFKSRVFQPNCKFRYDWATNLPKGMNIPTPADTSELAMISYKKYMNNLSKGNGQAVKNLDNARARFMTPDCWYLNDPSQFTKPFNVAFK
jgi:hypothetical protein